MEQNSLCFISASREDAETCDLEDPKWRSIFCDAKIMVSYLSQEEEQQQHI